VLSEIIFQLHGFLELGIYCICAENRVENAISRYHHYSFFSAYSLRTDIL
jgi:hypothetical protein